MSDFLIRHLDIVYFFYGLSFVVMGVIIFSQLKIIRESSFKLFNTLWLLAWFGVLHGANEFIEMFTIIHAKVFVFRILAPILLISSFIFLFCFGYQLIRLGDKRVAGIKFAGVVAGVFLAAVLIVGIRAEVAWINSSRYFLCFPAGVMSAIGLLLYYRNNYKQLSKLNVRGYFVLAAFSFLCYAVFAGLVVKKAVFFPASVFNFETFVSFVHIPVQCLRAVCASGIAFSVWHIMGIFDAEELAKRKKAGEEQRLSDIGVLAATVAHELRNPLSAIGVAAYNIKRKAKTTDFNSHLVNIEKKIYESDQIINNLLFYSRLKPPRYEGVNITKIIEECAEVTEKHSNKEVSIVKNLDPVRDYLIKADPFQISEVFSNILNNACDAIASIKGEIVVTGEDENEFVKVTVKDNGQGIEKTTLAKIFNPFFTTKAKGTGLGLSVCQQIIKMHAGSMSIDSEPGKGTVVIVRFPKQQTKA